LIKLVADLGIAHVILVYRYAVSKNYEVESDFKRKIERQFNEGQRESLPAALETTMHEAMRVKPNLEWRSQKEHRTSAEESYRQLVEPDQQRDHMGFNFQGYRSGATKTFGSSYNHHHVPHRLLCMELLDLMSALQVSIFLWSDPCKSPVPSFVIITLFCIIISEIYNLFWFYRSLQLRVCFKSQNRLWTLNNELEQC
jgi:hypothetical protein